MRTIVPGKSSLIWAALFYRYFPLPILRFGWKAHGLPAGPCGNGRTCRRVPWRRNVQASYPRFSALNTARTDASSMFVSTPAPQRVRPSAYLI